MKRLLVLMLVTVAVGSVAPPAFAGDRAGPSGGAPLALPAEVMSALEEVAAASLAPVPASSAGPQAADVRLAEAIRGLARSVDSIPPDAERAFAVFVGIQSELLRREIVTRLRTGSLSGDDDGPLAGSLRELNEAKLAWLERSPQAGADGPDMRCHIELVQCLVWCQNLPTFVLRAACGFDCESDYLRCTGIAGVIKDLLPGLPGIVLP